MLLGGLTGLQHLEQSRALPAPAECSLYLAVTWLGSLSLEAALKQLIETGRIDDPLLARLDDVAQEVEGRNVYAVVSDTLRALSLFDVVARWPDAVQARANLLRLQSEAGEFMSANREAKASVGLYGDGLASFQAWLTAKLTDEKKNKQPAPRVQDEDAIELVTWHAAKGREWPVVVVGELDRQVGPRLPNLEIGYEHFQDLANLLDHAKVEFTPKFDAPETTERFSAALQQAAEVEARRLLYVAMTRPREKLVLNWPSYLDGNDKVSYWSILKTTTQMDLEGSKLRVGDEKHAVIHHLGDDTLPGDLDLDASPRLEDLSVIGRLAIDRKPAPDNLTPDSVSPSTLEPSPEEAGDLEVFEYAKPLAIKSSLPSHDLGTRLHRYFEVLGAKPALKKALLGMTCDANFPPESGETVAERVEQFESWLRAHFETSDIGREVPILSLTAQNSVMSGVIDLVVRTPEGVWIIDHKSDQVEDASSPFANYLPQLQAYADALQKTGDTVLGIGIHWIRRGEVVMHSLPAP